MVTFRLLLPHVRSARGNDIEYLDASCPVGEVAAGSCGAGTADFHIHPMEPRSAR